MTGTVVLEALAQCGTAAFDKTGTLTTGQLAATSMRRARHSSRNKWRSSPALPAMVRKALRPVSP